jgi:hypothetical protein
MPSLLVENQSSHSLSATGVFACSNCHKITRFDDIVLTEQQIESGESVERCNRCQAEEESERFASLKAQQGNERYLVGRGR